MKLEALSEFAFAGGGVGDVVASASALPSALAALSSAGRTLFIGPDKEMRALVRGRPRIRSSSRGTFYRVAR